MVDHGNEILEIQQRDGLYNSNHDSKNETMKTHRNDKVVDKNHSVTNNPAMDRVQSALKVQLARTRDRILRQFQEEQHSYSEAKKEREDCGVELYGIQQQLSQLQNKLDDSGNQHEGLRNKTKVIEENFIQLRNEVKTRVSKKDELKVRSSKRKEEWDEVDSMLKQARKFNQETKNEVMVTKRAASKAEEVVKGTEKGKEAQDIYIDSLNQQIKQLETETKWSVKLLDIQKKQTDEADKVTKELTQELDILSSEKKRLVQQWNSALLALGRRDQALGAVTNETKEARNKSKDNSSEIIGLSRESFNISLQLEKATFDKNKIENEVEFIEDSIVKSKSDQEAFASQQELISQIITNTQVDENQEERNAKRYLSNVASLEQKIEVVAKEKRELEDL